MRLLDDLDFAPRPFDSEDEQQRYAGWAAWAEDLSHLRRIALATERDVKDELAAIAAMTHEEAGNCIDCLCHALVPVIGGGVEVPDSDDPLLHIEPAWHERGLTRQEADRISELFDILRHQAERTETPGYEPDSDDF